MKPIEEMTVPELQKQIDDSLFSEIAWQTSQIYYRECLRGYIHDIRSCKRVSTARELEGALR